MADYLVLRESDQSATARNTGGRIAALAQTVQSFKPPVMIRTRCKTDSTNIRLYFAKGRVILNWEMRIRELRFDDPETRAGTWFPGTGYLTPKEWHTVIWEIRRDSMRLLVDGEVRLEKRGHYAELDSQAGIGPCLGSVVTLQSFVVAKID
jgi:hypothetical protein